MFVWSLIHIIYSLVYCITSNCNPEALLFLPINKDKTLQIVLHCDIIQGCATIKFYNYVHTTILLNITFLLAINDSSYNSFSCLQLLIQRDHTYRAIWTLDIGWDGDNHDIFVVVVIITEYIVGHVLKAITYHHLLL